jgi:hypothetical protein
MLALCKDHGASTITALFFRQERFA